LGYFKTLAEIPRYGNCAPHGEVGKSNKKSISRNSLARLKIPEEGEEAEAETKKGKPKPKPKGKGKAKPKLKEDRDAALKPDDKMSLHLKELSPLEARTSVLVQVPATAGCASCRVVSTGCISNNQRWQCRRWMVNA